MTAQIQTTVKSIEDNYEDSVEMLTLSRVGISFELFVEIQAGGPFTLSNWSRFLHLTERTIQRYKKELRAFDPIYSEKIIAVAHIQKRGREIFGSIENFKTWMNSKIIALGGIPPIDLMDTSFGLDMIEDEMTRIEHGVLA